MLQKSRLIDALPARLANACFALLMTNITLHMVKRYTNLWRNTVLSVVLSLLACNGTARSNGSVEQFMTNKLNNNWAVLVCTSRYWFNYRHFANTLSLYRTVKRLGIPDSHIILMLPDDMSCNPRNPYPGQLMNNVKLDLYGDNMQVDYRGYEVTVESFIRVLTGRHDPAVPLSQRLLSDSSSNVLLYLSGHGGEGFMKFQGSEEMMSHDLAGALSTMWEAGRYAELMLIVDTCQASSLMLPLQAPNVLALVSSKTGESSYSFYSDQEVGLSVIDRFSYFLLSYLEGISIDSRATLQDMIQHLRSRPIGSTVMTRTDLFSRRLSQVPILDFFGSVKTVETEAEEYPLAALDAENTRQGSRNKAAATHCGSLPSSCDHTDAPADSLEGSGFQYQPHNSAVVHMEFGSGLPWGSAATPPAGDAVFVAATAVAVALAIIAALGNK